MDVRPALRRAAPYAAVLALALAGALALGVHLSNAQPSAARPFGWSGPSKFTNGAVMVRDDEVVAASLPALLLGVRAVGDLALPRDRSRHVAAVFGLHVAALAVAVAVATGIGAWAADSFTWNGVRVFAAAHALLAAAFYALGFLVSATMARPALATAGAVWIFFTLAFERIVRLALYRNVGYDGLLAGQFPTWFYAAQVASPLAAYRGVLILGERGFMDFLERTALGGAALPAYVNPWTFAAALVVLWVLLPLGLALAAWKWRQGAVGRGAAATEATG